MAVERGRWIPGLRFADGLGAVDVLRCDLEGPEVEFGAASIRPQVSELFEDLGERVLDVEWLFQHGEFERPGPRGGAVKTGVEVAIGHTPESGGLALQSIGLDVTTFRVHACLPRGFQRLIPPYPPFRGKFFDQQGLRVWVWRKFLKALKLFGKY